MPKKTLLLADDSVTIQRVIELTFANEDVRVVSVGDGRRAVEWCEGETPDVILADVNVPQVDGYALAEFVKQSPRLRHVPVLLLAGAFEPIDQERVRVAGADGVLVKPFEPQQLVSRVRELLERVPEPALAAVAVEPSAVVGADHAATVHLASQAPTSTLVDHAGPAFGQPATFASPEPLEAPDRPVWELGLPEPIHQTPRPIDPVHAAAAAPPKVSLVSAFSALLAAEQSSTPAPVAAAPVTEATVEDAVRRVLTKMTDDLVRRIVLETAERLIKEEIEKIKANPE